MLQTLPLPNVKVKELMASGKSPYLSYGGRMGPRDKALVAKSIEATSTAGLSEKLVRSLSGGERQRVYLAMHTAQDTDIILLD